MKTALHFLALAGAALMLTADARAQYNAPPTNYGGSPSTSYGAAPRGYLSPAGGQADAAAPGRFADGTGAPAARQPSVYNPTPAEQLGSERGPWIVIAPYAWVFGMNGTVGAGGRTTNVSETVWDSIDAIKDVRGAAMIHLEAGYDRVGLIADLMYLRVEPPGDTFQVDMRSTLAELLGFYRVIDTGCGPGACTFDVLAGVRYYRFRTQLTVVPFDVTPVDRTEDWYDAVVGARFGVQLLECFGVFARGDVGGFDLCDNSSKIAWNALAGFDLRCCECLSILGGYRWLCVDYSTGTGTNAFTFDMTMHGPFAALALRF